jgi:hypothetical protein
LAIAVAGCSKPDPQTAAPQATPEAAAEDGSGTRKQCEGFSFEVPTGWSSVPPDRPKTKAMLLIGAEPWNTAKGMIKIDVGAPATPDLKTMAEGLAGNFGGKVQPGQVDVDGETGVRVQASPQGPSLAPREGIVVFHSGKMYLIMAGAVRGTDVADALEHVRATWKWDD